MLTECPSNEIEKVIGRLIKRYKDTEYGSDVKVNYVYKYNTSE